MWWDVEQDRHGPVVDQRHLHIGTELAGGDVRRTFAKRLDIAVVEFLGDRRRCGRPETRSIAAPGIRGHGELRDREYGTAGVEHGSVHRLGPVRKDPGPEGSFGQSPGGDFVVIAEHRNEHQQTVVDLRDLAIGDRHGRLAHSLQQRAQETSSVFRSKIASMGMHDKNANAPKRAAALISGGLDSMLAAKVVLDQGVDVEGINFFTGFCVEGHTHAIRKKDRSRQKRNNALWVAEQLGIKLHIIDVIDEYKDIVLNPKHGYGANLNPCLDCKIFMVNKALTQDVLDRGFDFVITGEVIGQRPKSQRADTMPVIARESGAGDRLLRPLCALNLPPTLPEREGWVDRDKLFGFHGRDRKPQMALADAFGFSDYAQPAGGCCFLTDERYAGKLADLWEARGVRDYDFDDIMLLKVGRHIRPAPHYKLIVGREEGENNFLSGYRRRFVHINTVSHTGPLTLIDGEPTDGDLVLAARIAARYSQGRTAAEVSVNVHHPSGTSSELRVAPLLPTELEPAWHVGG